MMMIIMSLSALLSYFIREDKNIDGSGGHTIIIVAIAVGQFIFVKLFCCRSHAQNLTALHLDITDPSLSHTHTHTHTHTHIRAYTSRAVPYYSQTIPSPNVSLLSKSVSPSSPLAAI